MSTPLILAYAGMAIMLTLSCIGSAIGVTMAGNTTVAGLKKKPDMFGKAMLLGVLPSTQGLYGFAGFFLMLSSLGSMEEASTVLTMNQGLAMCAAGLALGFVGLWSAIKQASLVSNGINEMSNGHDVFSRTPSWHLPARSSLCRRRFRFSPSLPIRGGRIYRTL